MTPVVDAYATAPWYVDHIAPIWLALGEARGQLHVGPMAAAVAAGLPAVTRMPVGGGGRPVLTVAYGDMATARRAGRPRLALGQHGAGQSYSDDNPSYPGGGHQDEVGLFLVPNATAARRTLARYPKARVAVVGCAKLDTLPGRVPGGPVPTVAISVHWDARVSAESSSAWPHFRQVLLQLAKPYAVLGHGHPRMMTRLQPYYRAAGIEVVASFRQVLERADLYICDNSSSMFEFAATGRPVVVLNAPTYRREREHGLRFWEAAAVGVQVNGPRELAGAVARALELRPADVAAREAALDLVYQPRRGGAQLAAQALVEWAAGR